MSPLPERADNHSVGKQVLLFRSGFNVKSRGAGHPTGSCRQRPPREPTAATCPASGRLPRQRPRPPALQWARRARQGKGQPGAGIAAAGKGHAALGTVGAGSHHPPGSAVTGPASLRRTAHFSPAEAPPLVARRCQRLRFGALPGAQLKAPAVTLGAGPPAQRRAKGGEPLVCFGQQRRVVTQGMGCDTGDRPVFPCSLHRLGGGGLLPRLVISHSWWPDVLFFLFFFFIHYF